MSDNNKVAFTAMEHGTQSDYELVFEHDAANAAELPDRLLEWLSGMDGPSPYRISRLDHCLQTATRAERDGADEETIVCALLHDIGDVLAPTNHSQVAAALLAPYVSEKNRWIVAHHGLFQGYYWFQFVGQDRHARDKYRDHEHFDACVDSVRAGIRSRLTRITMLTLSSISRRWSVPCSHASRGLFTRGRGARYGAYQLSIVAFRLIRCRRLN